MGLFSKIFGKAPTKNDHLVTVHIKLSPGAMQFNDIEPLVLRLKQVMGEAGTGMFQGTDRDQAELRIYLYGANADRLFSSINPVLDQEGMPPGSFAMLRYGPAGSPERRCIL